MLGLNRTIIGLKVAFEPSFEEYASEFESNYYRIERLLRLFLAKSSK